MGTPLKIMFDWGDRCLPVTARLRSKFFINIGGPQGHATPSKEHVEKITGYFRFLPGAARLRPLFFITLGGPQGHGHSLTGSGSVKRVARVHAACESKNVCCLYVRCRLDSTVRRAKLEFGSFFLP
jgi:hypothetical protein